MLTALGSSKNRKSTRQMQQQYLNNDNNNIQQQKKTVHMQALLPQQQQQPPKVVANNNALQNNNKKPPEPSPLIGETIKGRWHILSSLGKGAFGEVFLTRDLESKQTFAMKVEHPNAKKQVLKLEVNVLRKVASDCTFFPKFLASGRFSLATKSKRNKNNNNDSSHASEDTEPAAAVAAGPNNNNNNNTTATDKSDDSVPTYTFMILQLLGSNLSDIRRNCGGKFSIMTTGMLALQMLRALESLHRVGILHRDVKPGNFCISRTPSNASSSVPTGGKNISPPSMGARPQCYLIDFGLSRRYLTQSGKVREARSKIGFRGTARYASIAAHQGRDLGTADDLWSLFYVIVEFLVGTLPWKGKEKEKIGEIKAAKTNQDLVKDLPRCMTDFYHYLSSLKYGDKPDYQFIYELLTTLDGCGNIYPGCVFYDWELKSGNSLNGNPISITGTNTVKEKIANNTAATGVAKQQKQSKSKKQQPKQRHYFLRSRRGEQDNDLMVQDQNVGIDRRNIGFVNEKNERQAAAIVDQYKEESEHQDDDYEDDFEDKVLPSIPQQDDEQEEEDDVEDCDKLQEEDYEMDQYDDDNNNYNNNQQGTRVRESENAMIINDIAKSQVALGTSLQTVNHCSSILGSSLKFLSGSNSTTNNNYFGNNSNNNNVIVGGMGEKKALTAEPMMMVMESKPTDVVEVEESKRDVSMELFVHDDDDDDDQVLQPTIQYVKNLDREYGNSLPQQQEDQDMMFMDSTISSSGKKQQQSGLETPQVIKYPKTSSSSVFSFFKGSSSGDKVPTPPKANVTTNRRFNLRARRYKQT